jgi:hypothetical protein
LKVNAPGKEVLRRSAETSGSGQSAKSPKSNVAIAKTEI